MARPKKPASMRTGHTVSKKQLREEIENEKKLKGNDDLIDEIPNIIAMNENAKEYYVIITKMLKESDILSNFDRWGVADMADALAKYQEANEDLEERGKTIMQSTKSGEKEIINPSYQYYKDASNSFKKSATQFGLTPSSRAQLSELALQKKGEDTDPLTLALNNLNNERDKANEEQRDKKEEK